MLNEKEQILEENDFLNERINIKNNIMKERIKKRYFFISVFISLFVISLIYLLSDSSRIYRIVVSGNVYLSDEKIIEISGISTNDRYIFVNSGNVENRIKDNSIIDNCKVEVCKNRLVKISIVEKKIIGYSYEDENNVLILEDDSRVILEKKDLYLIEKVPLIEGFTKDSIILIEKNLKDVDYRTINEISEIHYYPALRFQNHELIMRDGNYIFTSVYGLPLINRYYEMESSYTSEGNKCYYIEDISRNAYTSACPWQEEAVKEETNDIDSQETDEIKKEE